MKTTLALLALALAGTAAFAQTTPTCGSQTIPLCSAETGAGDVQVKPIAVPTSTTIVSASNAWLSTVTVSNPTSGAITFTLSDRQASPLAVLGAVSIAANTSYVVVWPAWYWCPNGFTVTSSGAGLTFYARFKQ